ncbi:MAG: hypothetical protein KAH14_05275 [Clostridiales bacterium]|nr:hypothetical protein [Clostridiales bacterium]
MDLIYGTTNLAKVNSMRKWLKRLPLSISGLSDLGNDFWEPEESGDDPLINAELKARGYYKQIGRPVFSCDSGLYFDEVSAEDQPGVHIRRMHGQNLKDEEFIGFYGKLAAKYGGKLTAHYRNSICLVMDDDSVFKYAGEDLYSPKFGIIEEPHKKYKPGFPLDSISVHIESGLYYYDLKKTKYDDGWNIDNGYRTFFIENLGLTLEKEKER